MDVAVVARDEELGAVYRFLDRRQAPRGPVALALEGDAGIGKSTLWEVGVDAARELGLRVLSTRPAESEQSLAHAALGDLFGDILDDVLPALTPPQRRALDGALLVDDANGAADPLALGVAVRNALQLLAEDGLLVAIDDVQWLDASSGSALAFALRRLPDSAIRLLWTRRLGETPERSALEDALGPTAVEHLRVGPLSVGAIHQVVRGRFSRAVPRRTLLRLHEVSGGNPFYALELARAVGPEHDALDPTQPLPVPGRLEELVSARLAAVTGPAREALVLASVHGRLTPAQLSAAGIPADALDTARDAQVVELARGTVRFTHPLLASVLYQGLAGGERQHAHRVAADLSEDSLDRARHLALSKELPDADLASELERAASSEAGRRAPIAAADLWEHALRLTPLGLRADVDRRAAAAAHAHLAAGDVERARVLAQEVLDRAAPGAQRAEALRSMAVVEADEPTAGIPRLEEALREPDLPAAVRASLHHRLSLIGRFILGLETAGRHARAAVELTKDLADPTLRAKALAALAIIRFNSGEPDALALAEQAYAFAPDVADTGFALAHVLVWSVELERARVLLEHMLERWSERDERLAATALWYLAIVELRAARLALADEHASRALQLNALYARDGAEPPPNLYPSTLVAAHRGDFARARELAERLCALTEVYDTRLAAPLGTLATVDLWEGDAEAALPRFAAAEAVDGAADGVDPAMCWWRAEHVEALLETARVDEAAARLDEWEAEGRRLGRAWVVAHARRLRGLVAAARGDAGDAVAVLAAAADELGNAGDPFGRARALLALGTARRRLRQKRAAREALEAARGVFEEIGASGWSERVERELGRIGGRTTADGLTPAERRVADLVAQGRTNAEVAAALFLAERTVASHLTHVYAKLGVRTRTELARKLA